MAFPDVHANLAVSAVATAPSPASSGTSLVVTAGQGSRFPSSFPYNCTIWPAGSLPDPSNAEIVTVTGRSTDTLTITRAQESTSARTVVVGDYIALTVTAKTITDLETLVGTRSNPAQSGALRLDSAQWITARNAANSGDLNLWRANASDFLDFSTRIDRDDFGLYTATKNWIALRRNYTTVPTAGERDAIIRLDYQSKQSGTISEGRVGLALYMSDRSDVTNKTISGMSRSGTTVTVTATGHGYSTGDKISIYGVVHTFDQEVNGVWIIANALTNTFDITVASLSSGSYTSGGTATNRGQFQGFTVTMVPNVTRGGLTGTAANGDDVAPFAVLNGSTVDGRKVSDAFYVAHNSTFTGSEFGGNFATDAYVDRAFTAGGHIAVALFDGSRATYATGAYAVDLHGGTYNGTAKPLRLPIDLAVTARNAAGSGDQDLFKLTSSPANELQLIPSVRFLGNITWNDGIVIAAGTTTGTKIGFTTSDKLSLWGATPIVQPSNTTDLRTAMINIGLLASGGANPLDLNGGVLTALRSVFALGTITADAQALSITGTWNQSTTTFNAARINITDTASAGQSLLLDLQVGSTSKATVDKLGNVAANYLDSNHDALSFYDRVTTNTTTLQLIAGAARTVTSAVAATNNRDARGEWLRISATSNNADSSLVGTFTITRTDWDCVFETRVQISGTANERIKIGLMSAAATQTTDTENSIHSAFFRFSTNASDTNWQCCTSNASSTTVTNSNTAASANTAYVLKIDCTDSSNIRFYINGTLVATNTATLPTSSTNLGPVHYLRSLSASGQKDLDVEYTSIWQA